MPLTTCLSTDHEWLVDLALPPEEHLYAVLCCCFLGESKFEELPAGEHKVSQGHLVSTHVRTSSLCASSLLLLSLGSFLALW